MSDQSILVQFVEAAKHQGHNPALVLLKDKKPCQKNWPELRPTVKQAITHLKRNPSRNAIGVQPASLEHVVLDCDEGDGPQAAAELLKERYGDVVACETPSTSGRADRGHVWVRCDSAAAVGNWKFKLQDGIDEILGDMRSTGGQVRLNDQALLALTEMLNALDGLEEEASTNVFRDLRTSTTTDVDLNFDRASGVEVNEDIIAVLADRLDGPDGGPRHEHFFVLAADLKKLGTSFDASLELLSHYAPLWPTDQGDDDGKYAGTEVERHLAMAWAKLPPYVAAADDFDDDLEVGLIGVQDKTQPHAIRPTYKRKLKVANNNRAPDTYTNAKAGIYKQGLRPAYNELKQTVTFLGDINWPESYGREANDHTIRMVRDLLTEAYQGNDYQPSKDNVYEATMSLSYENKYHPVLDYLDGLKWDGASRCKDLFIKGFPCVDNARYLDECGVRFMISAAARARRPGCKVDTMPVICSPQGSLKSTGVAVLFGSDWSSDAAIPDLKSKDAAIVLRGTWCHEYAELAGMGNQDVGTLKAFLSRATDTYRAPYGRTADDHPRRCVFFGTVNETGYLRDPTGGRRFWPMEMAAGTRVDVDWLAVNRDQLWAEADARLADNERWWLEDEAWSLALERAADETIDDPWAAEISDYLEARLDPLFDEEGPPPSENRIFTKDLLQALGIGGGRARQAESKRLRLVMEKEIGGWKYRRKLRVGDETYPGYYRVSAAENASFFGN